MYKTNFVNQQNPNNIYVNAEYIYNLWKQGKSAFVEVCNTPNIHVSMHPMRGTETAFYISDSIIKGIENKYVAINKIVAEIHKQTAATIRQQRSLLPQYRTMNIED